MKFIYIVNARMPTDKAYGLQIIQMLQAFQKLRYPLCHPKIGGVLGNKESIKSELENNKIEVELVIPKRLNHIKLNIYEYYKIPVVFKIRKLPCVDFSKLGLDGTSIGFLIQSLSFTISLVFYFLFKKADIVYSRDPMVLMPFIFSKKKIFFEIHNLSRFFFIYKKILQKADGIIAITNGLKNFLIEKGIKDKKILVAPDGVDFDKFDLNISKEEARGKIGLPKDKKVILYSGHLYEWKGADLLMKVASQYQTSNIKHQNENALNILFMFVGGTEKDVKKFKEKAEKENLKNVFIAGRKPHEKIPLWLKAADVLILPNSGKEKISAFFTSPLKMFEYMAAKRPIIASDLPSIKEVLNSSNSILAEADNPESFLEAIEKILQNKELSAKIEDKAYHDAQEYTWSKRAQRIMNFVMYEIVKNQKSKIQLKII